jgi:ABC-2 type transport system permease protein
MKNFLILRLLDRFRRPITAMGADYPVFRRILQVKLTMDSRRMPTAFSNSRKKAGDGAENANYFARSLWMYGLFGLILMPFVLLGDHYVFQMSFVFGMMMFMVMTSLIADFSSVMLDVRDKNLLYTRPVEPRTVALAKAAHICIYLFMITGTLAAPSLIAGTIRHGVAFGALFALLAVLSTLLLLVATAFIYLLILKLFDGEKLKDFINYVQIGMTLVMTVGYQLIGRAFDLKELKIAFHPKWWQIFIPPVWYGSVFEWLLNGGVQMAVAGLALLGLLAPIAALAVYIKLLPVFERQVQKLSEQEAVSRRKARFDLTGRLSRLLCRTPVEQSFFRFAVRMMGQEREFKLKVYPSMGFSIIFPFIFLFNIIRDEGLTGLSHSKAYLCIYMGTMMVPTVVMLLKHSGKYKGAWIFRALPLDDYAPFFKGTLKAFAVRLLLPVFGIQAAIMVGLMGLRVLPHMVIVLAAITLYTTICYMISDKVLPFTVPFEGVQQDFAKSILLVALLGVFWGAHYGATFLPYGAAGYLLLLAAANAVLWRCAFPRKGIPVQGLNLDR